MKPMHDHHVRQIEEIRQVLNRYARAVDTHDWDLYRSLFTEDATLDYTSVPFGIRGSREEIVEWLSDSLPLMAMTMHYITNVEAHFDEDTAAVRAQFYNPMQFPGSTELSSCGGYYHHEMVRTPDGWRSRNLREENVWFVNPPGLAD